MKCMELLLLGVFGAFIYLIVEELVIFLMSSPTVFYIA